GYHFLVLHIVNSFAGHYGFIFALALKLQTYKKNLTPQIFNQKKDRRAKCLAVFILWFMGQSN
ncbi:MAG: hypothetical protein SPF79_09220, partial [Bacteroidaceae bacterium]|nr:hypothetical protein [Bacteroidaceae bacterium]